jgi:hypothetical protein
MREDADRAIVLEDLCAEKMPETLRCRVPLPREEGQNDR